MQLSPPGLNKTILCVVNDDNPVLAAIVSSYLLKPGEYLPMFAFPHVEKPAGVVDKDDENFIMVTRATEFGIHVHNAIKSLGVCEYIITAGLNETQKTYLDYLSQYTVIEIIDENDVDNALCHLTHKNTYVLCSKKDIFIGLSVCLEQDSILQLDESVTAIATGNLHKSGLVVVEAIERSSVIIAINYAAAVNANIKIINPPNVAKEEILADLEAWGESQDFQVFLDLSAKVFPFIEDITFSDYEYCTFFTEGIPYSFILKNVIPFTHVHLYLRPDFFVFNAILYEQINKLFSVVVFSPLEFGNHEETRFVTSIFNKKQYYVRELIGDSATAYELDKHISEFPYSIMHLCSHGGEIGGHSASLHFEDLEGLSHFVEFDEAVTFAPDPFSGKIIVVNKYMIRKLDGLFYHSPSLKELGYSRTVYTAMHQAIGARTKVTGNKVKRVQGSSAIKCKDFWYQTGSFNMLAAANSNPVIFNNTCWSWSDVSESFIAVGARAYIGTLWNVNNLRAKRVAETFYECAFDSNIVEALKAASIYINGTADEDIYLIWGLPFSTIMTGKSSTSSKFDVARRMLISIHRWENHLITASNTNTQETIKNFIIWGKSQLTKHFPKEIRKLFWG